MKIGIDIDGVLGDCIKAIHLFYNRVHDKNLKPEDYKHYDLNKVWGVSKARATQIVSSFFLSSEFEQIIPVEGSQEAVNELSGRHHLIALTSRPESTKHKTEEWFNRYFGNSIKEILFNGQYCLESSLLDKSNLCLRKGIELLVEDNLDISYKCAEKGIRVFLLDTLGNKNYEKHRNLIKVRNWNEILENLR